MKSNSKQKQSEIFHINYLRLFLLTTIAAPAISAIPVKPAAAPVAGLGVLLLLFAVLPVEAALEEVLLFVTEEVLVDEEA